MRFEVTVYHVHDVADYQSENLLCSDDPGASRREQTDASSLLSVVRLGSAIVAAGDERLAAAKGWIVCVGVDRRAKLEDLRAPQAVIEAETDVWLISRGLSRTSLCPGGGMGFQLDNQLEAWVISVEYKPSRFDCEHSCTRNVPSSWLEDPIHPARLFDAIREASRN